MAPARHVIPLVLLLMAPSVSAWAGVVALGFEIGKATVDDVTATVSKRGRIQPNGVNRFTGGQMLKADGAAFDVDELYDVIFTFDEHRRLVALIMELPEARFDSALEHLRAKYKVAYEQVPRTGDRLVRFHGDTTTIEVDCPDMSLVTQVRYVDDGFLVKLRAAEKQERQDRSTKEAAQF